MSSQNANQCHQPTNPPSTLIHYRRSRCSFQAGTTREKESCRAPLFRIPGDIAQAHVGCTMSFFAQELPEMRTYIRYIFGQIHLRPPGPPCLRRGCFFFFFLCVQHDMLYLPHTRMYMHSRHLRFSTESQEKQPVQIANRLGV